MIWIWLLIFPSLIFNFHFPALYESVLFLLENQIEPMFSPKIRFWPLSSHKTFDSFSQQKNEHTMLEIRATAKILYLHLQNYDQESNGDPAPAYLLILSFQNIYVFQSWIRSLLWLFLLIHLFIAFQRILLLSSNVFPNSLVSFCEALHMIKNTRSE